MDFLFQLPLYQQSIITTLIFFLLIAPLLVFIFRFIMSRDFSSSLISGFVFSFVISLLLSMGWYFGNDAIYKTYFKAFKGPQYITEANTLNVSLNRQIPMIVDGAFGLDEEAERMSLNLFKDDLHLSPVQYRRMEDLFNVCYMELFGNPSSQNPVLSQFEGGYPISHSSLNERLDHFKGRFEESKRSYDISKKEYDLIASSNFDAIKNYGPGIIEQMKNNPERYMRDAKTRMNQHARISEYQFKHPICLTEKQIPYILGDLSL